MRMKFTKGLITGSALGIVVGMIILPKMGTSQRKAITVTSDKMSDRVGELLI